MEQSLVALVVSRVVERFQKEEEFYEKQLGLTVDEWTSWKRGDFSLPEIAIGQIAFLFTDYEWMLVNKVIAQSRMIPEKELSAVADYHRMAVVIAKKWLSTDIAQVELIEKVQTDDKQEKMIEVRVMVNFDAWGYEDILTFYFPAVDRNKVAGSKVELIQLMTEKYENEE
jgi:hypothetical protein